MRRTSLESAGQSGDCRSASQLGGAKKYPRTFLVSSFQKLKRLVLIAIRRILLRSYTGNIATFRFSFSKS